MDHRLLYLMLYWLHHGSLHALHGNLLYQPLVIGLHSIQAIDHVVDAIRTVRRRITQGDQRAELLQVLLGLLSFYRLRLVDDQDGIGLGNDVCS